VGTELGATTLPAGQRAEGSNLRKLRPTAKLPTAAVLEALPPTDRRTLRRRLAEGAECMFDPCFVEAPAEKALYQAARGGRESAGADAKGRRNDDSGLDWLTATDGGGIKAGDERHQFLWLNYCRYRVLRILEEQAGQRLSARAAMELLRWEHATAQAREEIVRANVPLVLAMAKRTRAARVDFADLVSEGNLALLRAVDKFDCARGYKFSTYACRAILKSFSRVAARTARYRGHFPVEFDPTLEKSDHAEQKRNVAEDESVEALRTILGNNLAELSDVEERVIRLRFALDGAPEERALHNKTLEQVGAMIGLTKERVRQIQNKALAKLRDLLENG